MKQHAEIQSDVLGWVEGTLDAVRRDAVAHHLSECHNCRRYFETIAAVLEPSAVQPERVLAADPYLPVRVKALALDQHGHGGFREAAAFRWTWRTAAFVLALVLGIYMGESLSYRTPQITDHHIVYEYSNSFWDSGFETRWQTLGQVVGEELQ